MDNCPFDFNCFLSRLQALNVCQAYVNKNKSLTIPTARHVSRIFPPRPTEYPFARVAVTETPASPQFTDAMCQVNDLNLFAKRPSSGREEDAPPLRSALYEPAHQHVTLALFGSKRAVRIARWPFRDGFGQMICVRAEGCSETICIVTIFRIIMGFLYLHLSRRHVPVSSWQRNPGAQSCL